MKALGWIVILVVGLFVGGVLAILAGGDERRQAVADGLRTGVLELTDQGRGYNDGRHVWSCESPARITIEELPTLEGRRVGSSYNSGFLSSRMSWFGVSIREALARCLDLPVDRVEGPDVLDRRWLDVDAARAGGVLGDGVRGWDDTHGTILQGLLEGYDLTYALETQTRPHIRVVAGPGWARHEGHHHRGGSKTSSKDGWLKLRGPAGHLLNTLGHKLDPVADSEGLDLDARVEIELSWDPQDGRQGLIDALADQLDLHITEIEQEVPVAVIHGQPRAPFER